MTQPKIKFLLKLIKMRKAAERVGANRKQGVMSNALWLERHIQANQYRTNEYATRFWINNLERVEHIMFWKKESLVSEFNQLNIVG